MASLKVLHTVLFSKVAPSTFAIAARSLSTCATIAAGSSTASQLRSPVKPTSTRSAAASAAAASTRTAADPAPLVPERLPFDPPTHRRRASQPAAPPTPTTLVVGGGLVGTFLACTLARGGARVVLKTHCAASARKTPVGALCAEAGVALLDDLEPLIAALTANGCDDVCAGQPTAPLIDYTYIATKTYDHAAVAAELARFPALRAAKATVLCHNGYLLDPGAAFADAAAAAGAPPPEPIFKALVPGGYSFAEGDEADPAPRLVITNGTAPWGIVAEHDAADACADALAARGLPAAAGRGALASDARKFLVNASANLLACVADANCARLTGNAALVARMSALFREADALLRAAPRHARAFAAAGPAYESEVAAGLLPDTATLEAAVLAGVRSYGEHYPSSHKDFVQGKRLETESLNGYVVALGDELGVNVDAHRELLDQVNTALATRDDDIAT